MTSHDTVLTPRLATVLAVDVVDYSRHIASDLRRTVTEVAGVQELLRGLAEEHGGRITDIAGDAMVAVFDTVIGAIVAAALTQKEMARQNEPRPEDEQMHLRMGIHLGDILEQPDGSVYGDAVNIAARLESLCGVGGVVVSHEVRTAVGDRAVAEFEDRGEFDLKNIDRPLRVFSLLQEGVAKSLGNSSKARQRVTKGNLPSPRSELVGRERTFGEIRRLLDEAPLVSIVGMGGMGKTRMATELARRAGSDFPDGVWFVDLAAVQDRGDVVVFLAGVFGVTQQGAKGIEEMLVETLSIQRLLIVLDNCEHVTTEAARLSAMLIKACPNLKLLVTSREALSINEERIWPLQPLDATGSQSPAVALFVARAQAVLPTFDPRLSMEEIIRICRALDGIPLAIELAAARIRSLSPRQIEDRLDQRFRLLTGGSRDVRERHQTLLQAVRWSFDLLDEAERKVLCRAAVFAGGFTLEAAEAVCAGEDIEAFDVFDLIDSLVRKSLVTVTNGKDGVRYGMLETIRTFGIEVLAADGQEDAVRSAHARLFADEADRHFALWRSTEQAQAHHWLDLELGNLRTAFRFALASDDVDSAARIASSVGDMARFRLIEEAANWAEEVVGAAEAAGHPRLAILLTWSASSAWAYGRFEDAERFGKAAIALLDDPAYDDFVWAYGDLAFVNLFKGDVPKAVALLAEGAAHPADAKDRFILAFHLFILATTGGETEANRLFPEVVPLVEACGVPMAISIAYGAKGAALESVDEEAALAAYEHAVEVARVAGLRFMEALIAPRAVAVQARSGNPTAALDSFKRMLQSFGAASDIASVSAWRTALVVLFAKLGQLQAAATLHGTIAGTANGENFSSEHSEAVQKTRGALGERVFAAMMARGAAMSLREASDFAAVQVDLALAGFERSDTA